MNRKPTTMLARVRALCGAAALAVCASLALATPALAASTATYGNLTFSSDEALSGVMSDAEGGVVVSGDADITVTPATSPDGATITSIEIGGDGEAAYTGSITFEGVTLDPVSFGVTSANVTFVDCSITGTADVPAIVGMGECAFTFSGTNTLTGGAGASGADPTEGMAAMRMTGASAISVSGTMTVSGGAGGNLDAKEGTPMPGGAGIYAPSATLSMTSGTLTVKAGDTYTATPEATPRVLPVGLTVGKLELSNGTGVAGEGPEVTAIGWPSQTSTPLPIDGLDAGSADDETFYPWALQASVAADGSGANAFLMDFAGSGNTEPVVRQGWRWFNIAPHEVTDLELVAVSNMDEPVTELYDLANPLPDMARGFSYGLAVAPVFADLPDMEVYGWIEGTALPNPTVSPEGSIESVGSDGQFIVDPGFAGSSIAFSGEAQLPESITSLYPDLSASLSATFDVTSAKAVYRLYNPSNNDHLYSTDVVEVQACDAAGWDYEGAAWLQPTVASAGDYPVLRLYDPATGCHYFVPESDTYQLNILLGRGWEKDSPASTLTSLPASEGYAIYTLYDPNSWAGNHLYTANAYERDVLENSGWEINTTTIYSLPIELV